MCDVPRPSPPALRRYPPFFQSFVRPFALVAFVPNEHRMKTQKTHNAVLGREPGHVRALRRLRSFPPGQRRLHRAVGDRHGEDGGRWGRAEGGCAGGSRGEWPTRLTGQTGREAGREVGEEGKRTESPVGGKRQGTGVTVGVRAELHPRARGVGDGQHE